MKNRPQQSLSKNGVKRIFATAEQTKERIDFQKVLFFISRNGGPDEKKRKQKKDAAGIPTQKMGRNDHFQKDVKQRRAVHTVNFQSECVSAANRIFIKIGRFFGS